MNVLDAQLTEQQQALASQVLEALQLDNMKVVAKDQSLHFIQDRRAIHVPLSLIQQARWPDIRFLFRSILQSGPSVWNHEAPHIPFESYFVDVKKK